MTATANPFATVATETKPTEQPEPEKLPSGICTYDLETVPDESRFPRPIVVEKVPREDIDWSDFVTGTVKEVTKGIDDLCDSDLDLLADAENAKDKPRKTVLESIEKAKNGGEDTELAAWKMLAVNPFCCRIVAFGWAIAGKKPEAMTATNDDEEREILKKFWEIMAGKRKRTGYAIVGFDDNVIRMRSRILGVDPSRKLDSRKYGNREALDCMNIMFPAGKAKKLKDVASWLDIEIPAGKDMDGSQVLELYDAGNMTAISDYVKSDVVVERELYLFCQEFFAL